MASPGRYIRDQISGFSGILFGLLLIVISVHEERFVPRKKSDGLKAAAGGQELSASLKVETTLEVASEHHDRTLYVSSGIKSSELIHAMKSPRAILTPLLIASDWPLSVSETQRTDSLRPSWQ